MTTVSNLMVLITGDSTSLQTSLTKAAVATKGFETAAQSTSKKASSAFSQMGKSAKVGLGQMLPSAGFTAAGALGLVGFAAVKMALDFDDAFTRISTLSNNATSDINRWRGEVLQLAGETAQAPQELADALFFLSSAGLETNEVMEALEVSAQASAIGLGETEDVANIVASALNAYSDAGLDAVDVTDTLVAAVKAGRAEPEEFANALGRILPIASQAEVSFADVTASLAQLSNIGLDVNEATTAMRGALQALIAPGTQAADAMDSIGLSAQDMLDAIQTDGLIGAIRMLDEAAKKNTSTQADYIGVLRKVIPNVRSLTGVLGLTQQEAAEVDATFDQVSQSSGATADSMGKLEESAGFKMRQAFTQLQAALIELADGALPAIAGAFQFAADAAVDFFNLFDPPPDIALPGGGGGGKSLGDQIKEAWVGTNIPELLGMLDRDIQAFGEGAFGGQNPLETFTEDLLGIFGNNAAGTTITAPIDNTTEAMHELSDAAQEVRDGIQGIVTEGAIRQFENAEDAVANLADNIGSDFQTIRAEGRAAFVEDGEEFGKSWGEFVAGVIADTQDLRADIADNISFIGDEFGELGENASAAAIGEAFEDAADQTKSYGEDLLEVANIAGGKGADLSLWLQSLGPDGAHAADQIAGASDEMQRSIVADFEVAQGAAQDYATQLQEQIVGTLEDIEQALKIIVRRDYNINLDANTEKASNKIAALQAQVLALTGRPYNVSVNSTIGGVQQGTGTATGGIVRAASGMITQGPLVLAGEGAYATAWGRGAEAVIPLNGRGIDILGKAMKRASRERMSDGSITINIDRRRPAEEFNRYERFGGRK